MASSRMAATSSGMISGVGLAIAKIIGRDAIEAIDDIMAIEDLDGTFSFLVSTKDEIGYAKDRLAVKPMIMYENDDLVAVASEEVSLNRLFPGQTLNTYEPPPGTFNTWSRSI